MLRAAKEINMLQRKSKEEDFKILLVRSYISQEDSEVTSLNKYFQK